MKILHHKMEQKFKFKIGKLGSLFQKEDQVPPEINSQNATPNPVVEGGTIPIKRRTRMKRNTANHKRGGRWIIAVVMTLLVMNVAMALEVKTFDENLFEIDAFETGDMVVILVDAETQPLITISESEVVDKEMELIDEGKYRGMIQVSEEGEYEIKVTEGDNVDTTEIVVVNDLGFEWEEVEAQLEEEKEERKQIIEEAKKQAIERLSEEQEKSFWQKISNFLKEMWEWMFKGEKNEE